MNFESGKLHHIYNRGNRKQKIFLAPDSYRFFLAKMEKELIPLCEILCHCLMPDHYHLLIYGNESDTSQITPGRTVLSGPTGSGNQMHLLSRKIGTLQSSYKQAIDERFTLTGYLFQQKAKAKVF
jgi:putative transposase